MTRELDDQVLERRQVCTFEPFVSYPSSFLMFSLNLDHQATRQWEGQGHPQILMSTLLGPDPGTTHLLHRSNQRLTLRYRSFDYDDDE